MNSATRQLHHPAVFLLSAAVVYSVSLAIVRSLEQIGNASIMAAAVTADLVLIVPLLYYWLLVRGRGWPIFSCLPVFLLSLVTAAWIVPKEHHSALHVVEMLALPLEIAALFFLTKRGAQIFSGTRDRDHDDLYDRLRANAMVATGNRFAANILAFEAAILHYALLSWRSRPVKSAQPTFSHHRRVLYSTTCVGFAMIILLELVPVHILLNLWSPTAAWIASGLGLYSLLWLLGDYRAIVSRPSVIEDETLKLRVGLRWNAEVPLNAIRRVRRLNSGQPELGNRSVKAVILGAPRLVLELSRPVHVLGAYGWQRRVESIALSVDDEERFIQTLRSANNTCLAP